MKLIVASICFSLSVLAALFYAGIFGSVLFGILNTLVISLLKQKKSSKLALIVRFLIITLIGYVSMWFFGLIGADESVKTKLQLIKEELIAQEYEPSWVIISEKRNSIYNSILSKSASKSCHLSGKAIDIYVFDINGDGTFDKGDIKILKMANKMVESKNPSLRGAFGDYFLEKNGYFTKHMIHIDTRGISFYYSK
jgi:hypothetical protein